MTLQGIVHYVCPSDDRVQWMQTMNNEKYPKIVEHIKDSYPAEKEFVTKFEFNKEIKKE